METVEAGSKSLEVAVMEKVWGRQGRGEGVEKRQSRRRERGRWHA